MRTDKLYIEFSSTINLHDDMVSCILTEDDDQECDHEIGEGHPHPIGKVLTVLCRRLQAGLDEAKNNIDKIAIEMSNEVGDCSLDYKRICSEKVAFALEDQAFLLALIDLIITSQPKLSYDQFKRMTGVFQPSRIPQYSYTDEDGMLPEQIFNFSEVGIELNDWTDKGRWSTFFKWCLNRTDNYTSYDCQNLFEACFSILDYIVRNGYWLKQCNFCKGYFVRTHDPRAEHCDEHCILASNRKRMAIMRDIREYADVENIENMLRKRVSRQGYKDRSLNECIKDLDAFLEVKFTKKELLRNGAITSEEYVDFFKNYCRSLKR